MQQKLFFSFLSTTAAEIREKNDLSSTAVKHAFHNNMLLNSVSILLQTTCRTGQKIPH